MLFSSTVFSSILTLLTQALIASRLGPVEFGIFSSSLALVILLCPLIAMGSDGYFLKFFVKGNEDIIEFNSNWSIYFFSTLFPALMLFLIMDRGASEQLFLLMISQSLINFCVAIFQAKKQYTSVSIMLTLQSILRIVILALLIFFLENISINNIIDLYVFVAVLMVALCLFILTRAGFGALFVNYSHISMARCWLFIKKAAPFGFTTLLHLIYFQSDIIIIDRLYSSEEAGLYSAAFMILTAAYMIPSVIYQKYFLPIAHQLSSSGELDREYQYFKKGAKYILIIALFSMGIYYASSDFIVNLIYGEEYSESSIYLKILSICIIFRFLSSNSGVFLMTENLIYKKNIYMLICAIFNIVFNIIFIPMYGAIAAAITTVFTEILLCVLFYRGIKKYKFSKILVSSLC